MLSERWLITKWIKHITVQVGSVHPSGCKNKFTIKKFLSSRNHKLMSNVFWSWFNPKYGYKMVHKRSQSRVNTGDCYQRKLSRITFQTRSKTADTLLNHTTIVTLHKTKSPVFRSRPLIAYQTMPHHHATQNQATQPRTNLHPLTSWPLSGGRREPIYFLIYWLLFI